jgi:hypothetical protein
MLYQPNYETIKVIQAGFKLNNIKTILSYRSRFSIIRDIYCIPFSNALELKVILRQALFGSLTINLLLLAFNSWIMYFTYTYRLVAIPPFFFIEFELLQLLLAVLIATLLFSKSSHSLAHILSSTETETPTPYK